MTSAGRKRMIDAAFSPARLANFLEMSKPALIGQDERDWTDVECAIDPSAASVVVAAMQLKPVPVEQSGGFCFGSRPRARSTPGF